MRLVSKGLRLPVLIRVNQLVPRFALYAGGHLGQHLPIVIEAATITGLMLRPHAPDEPTN